MTAETGPKHGARACVAASTPRSFAPFSAEPAKLYGVQAAPFPADIYRITCGAPTTRATAYPYFLRFSSYDTIEVHITVRGMVRYVAPCVRLKSV